jgi:hypothetical protein
LKETVAAPVKKTENTAVGIRHADYVTPLYLRKLALTSQTSGGRSEVEIIEIYTPQLISSKSTDLPSGI